MRIGNREFSFENHTYVMGIINVTPDSFSDGGSFVTIDAVLKRAEKMVLDGVDIIDIGGESTRPGSTPVSGEEELERVIPAIEGITKHFDIPVSADTYKASVAEAAIRAGAGLINDVYGLRNFNGCHNDMARVISESGCACCLMQGCNLFGDDSRSTGYKSDSDSDIVQHVHNGLHESLCIARSAGIGTDRILLDPGIGFGKTPAENLQLLSRLSELNSLGFPMLLGASRKSVIGAVTGLPSNERLEGTLATTAAAVNAGYAFVRVHDVKENVRFIKMYEAILQRN